MSPIVLHRASLGFCRLAARRDFLDWPDPAALPGHPDWETSSNGGLPYSQTHNCISGPLYTAASGAPLAELPRSGTTHVRSPKLMASPSSRYSSTPSTSFSIVALMASA